MSEIPMTTRIAAPEPEGMVVAAMCLSKSQYGQLVGRVESVACRFWFKESARRALYDRLRSLFKITRVDRIPASEFDHALRVIDEIEPSVDHYVSTRCTDERVFIDTVLRKPPEMDGSVETERKGGG